MFAKLESMLGELMIGACNRVTAYADTLDPPHPLLASIIEVVDEAKEESLQSQSASVDLQIEIDSLPEHTTEEEFAHMVALCKAKEMLDRETFLRILLGKVKERAVAGFHKLLKSKMGVFTLELTSRVGISLLVAIITRGVIGKIFG